MYVCKCMSVASLSISVCLLPVCKRRLLVASLFVSVYLLVASLSVMCMHVVASLCKSMPVVSLSVSVCLLPACLSVCLLSVCL